MDTSQIAAGGGLLLGGQGDWASDRSSPCRLVLTSAGLQSCLSILSNRWEARWKIGLFQSNTTPRLSLTLADLVPADFSGYAGLLPLFSFVAPAMQGIYAVTTAHDSTWKHDGGPIANFVFGYYVVDESGVVMWAERFCPAPERLAKRGVSIRVRASFFFVNA